MVRLRLTTQRERDAADGFRYAMATTMLVLQLGAIPARALAQDMQLCFAAADRLKEGESLADAEKRAAHEACLRALSYTSSITQKYQLQEADFDIHARSNRP